MNTETAGLRQAFSLDDHVSARCHATQLASRFRLVNRASFDAIEQQRSFFATGTQAADFATTFGSGHGLYRSAVGLKMFVDASKKRLRCRIIVRLIKWGRGEACRCGLHNGDLSENYVSFDATASNEQRICMETLLTSYMPTKNFLLKRSKREIYRLLATEIEFLLTQDATRLFTPCLLSLRRYEIDSSNARLRARFPRDCLAQP